MSNKKDMFKASINYWVQETWLSWWGITVVFVDAIEYSKNFVSVDPSKSLAYCESKWEYMTAQITVNSTLLETLNNEEIEYCAVHELMHVILNEMREDLEDYHKHEERVATFLAHSFISTKKITSAED